MKKGLYEENGIGVSKTAPRVGDQVSISYKGLLKESGARNVKLHLGYNDKWEDSQYIEMNLSGDIFMATVPLTREGTLNFAFIDPVGNWDNNSGSNYSVRIMGTGSAKAETPMAGPYDSKPGRKRTLKAGAPVKEEAETSTEAQKTTGTKSIKTTGTRGKKASAPGPDSLLDTRTGDNTPGGGVPVIMPEATSGARKRGPGRKKKEQ